MDREGLHAHGVPARGVRRVSLTVDSKESGLLWGSKMPTCRESQDEMNREGVVCSAGQAGPAVLFTEDFTVCMAP